MGASRLSVILCVIGVVFCRTLCADNNETSDSEEDNPTYYPPPVALDLPVRTPPFLLQNNGGNPADDQPFDGRDHSGGEHNLQEQWLLSSARQVERYQRKSAQISVQRSELNELVIFSTTLAHIEALLGVLNSNIILFSNLDIDHGSEGDHIRQLWQLFTAEWQRRHRMVWLAYTNRGRPLAPGGLIALGPDFVITQGRFQITVQCRSASVCSHIAPNLWPEQSIDIENHAITIHNFIHQLIVQITAFKSALNASGVVVVDHATLIEHTVFTVHGECNIAQHEMFILSLARDYFGTLCKVWLDPDNNTINIHMPFTPELMMQGVFRALMLSAATPIFVQVDIGAPSQGAGQLLQRLESDYAVIEEGYEADDEGDD